MNFHSPIKNNRVRKRELGSTAVQIFILREMQGEENHDRTLLPICKHLRRNEKSWRNSTFDLRNFMSHRSDLSERLSHEGLFRRNESINSLVRPAKMRQSRISIRLIDLFWHATNATKETIRFYEPSVPFKATVFF